MFLSHIYGSLSPPYFLTKSNKKVSLAEENIYIYFQMCVCVCVHIYIYIYIILTNYHKLSAKNNKDFVCHSFCGWKSKISIH